MLPAILGLFLFVAYPSQQEPPLPAIEDFKEAVWQVMNTLMLVGDSVQNQATPLDNGKLAQYAYVEKETTTKLDSRGQPICQRCTETNVYQITRGPEEWQYYRKLISTNGVSVSEAKLAKQDAEQKQREQKHRDEIDRAVKEAQKAAEKRKSSNPKPAPSLTPEQQKQQQLDSVFNYFRSIYDIQVVRREVIDGHSTLLLSLTPRANTKTKDDLLKMLQHVAVRGWVREQDHQLVRLEADVIDAISFGLGLLAKIQKGSTLHFERRPINDELWAPVKMEATMNARILLLKGIRERQVSEFSNFRKYTVETTVKVIEQEPVQE